MFKHSDDMQFTPTPEHTPDEVETVVGPSVVVEGDFASEGNILIKGTVSGNVKTGRLLTVELGARILANVKAQEAIISGEVKGNLRADGKVELTESAKILGDITCKVLVIEAGAQLEGKVSMGGISIEGGNTEKKIGIRRRSKSVDEEVE